MADPINRPQHYTHSRIEPIHVVEAWKLGFNLGNCVKYVGRADHKGTRLMDLQKARWYLEREIQTMLFASVPTADGLVTPPDLVAKMNHARGQLPMDVLESADVIGIERLDGRVLLIKNRKGFIGDHISREEWDNRHGENGTWSSVFAVLVKNGEDLLNVNATQPVNFVIEGAERLAPPTNGAVARPPAVDDWIGVLPASVTDKADVVGVQFVDDGGDGEVLIVKNKQGAVGERITRAAWGKRYADSDVRAVLVRRDRLPEIPRKQAPSWLKHLRTSGERDIQADTHTVFGTIEDKVCHMLNGEPGEVFTVAQIEKGTGVERRSLCSCLSRLLRRGVIARAARGIYCSRHSGRVRSSRG